MMLLTQNNDAYNLQPFILYNKKYALDNELFLEEINHKIHTDDNHIESHNLRRWKTEPSIIPESSRV